MGTTNMIDFRTEKEQGQKFHVSCAALA